MGPVLSHSQTELPLLNLNDVTLADEDTNSMPTDTANKAIQGNALPFALQCGNANGATWWPNL